MNPSAFAPTKLTDFIGPAKDVMRVMKAKVDRLHEGGGNLKALIYGPPGCGKSAIANLTARQLSGHSLAIEVVNVKEVCVETVHEWIAGLGTNSLWGDWQVKIIDELDQCSRDAQTLLLSYLDRLPSGWAFIGTSNLDLTGFQDRFQTRLQQFKLLGPNGDVIADFLREHFDIPEAEANQIAVGAGGNVRAALLDAETYIDALVLRGKGGRR